MNEAKTLVEVFKHLQKNNTQGIYLIYDTNKKEFIPYEKLYLDALTTLAYLQDSGLKPKDFLILQLNDMKNFVKIFWACIAGGIIPVPLTPAKSNNEFLKLINVYKKIKIARVITDSVIFKSMLSDNKFIKEHYAVCDEIKNKLIIVDEDLTSNSLPETYDADPDDIAFIQFSSGSTGDPKGVVLKHENIIANISSIIKGMVETNKNDATISYLPLTHDMGLLGFHLTPVMIPLNHFILTPSLFIRKPGFWIELCEEHKISILGSTSTGLRFFIDDFNKNTPDIKNLSCIKMVFCGAEWIDPDVCNTFEKCLYPYQLNKNVIFPVYGLAEASLAVSFPKPGESLKIVSIKQNQYNFGEKIVFGKDKYDQKYCSTGKAVANCELGIFNKDNTLVCDEIIGQIKIRGKNVTSKYFNDPGYTNKIIDNNNWLNTGDIGFIKDDELFVLGRANDFVIINGKNIFMDDIENIVSMVSSLNREKTAACSYYKKESRSYVVLIFIKFRRSIEDFIPMVKNIQILLNTNTGIAAEEILPVKTIPRTTSGKKQKYKLLEDYENGLFRECSNKINDKLKEDKKILAEKSQQEQINEFIKIFFELEFGIINIHPEDNLFDYGINSILAQSAVVKLRNYFPSIDVSITTLFTYPSIGKLAKYIEENKRK